ncbi:MAG: hypothetical protein WA632_13495 [Gallionella sp.]
MTATAVLVVMAPSDNESNSKGGQVGKPPSNAKSEFAGQVRDRGQGVELERLARLEAKRGETGKVGNVFDPTSWYVPPPPVHYVPVPVAPSMSVQVVPAAAPPVPFTYLGRYGDNASRIIILAKGDKVYTVTIGDVIENTYRVERFTPGIIVLKYLPMNIEQYLRTGDPT